MKKTTPLLIITICIQSFAQIENIGEQITLKNLKNHIMVLASDSLEGREVGQPGEQKAADYMSNYFKNIGIPPYKDSTYYQKIPLEKRNLESASININNTQYEFKKDFYLDLSEIIENDFLKIFHSGTIIENGKVKVTGGRILSINVTAANKESATSLAYENIKKIKAYNDRELKIENNDLIFYRQDIGN